jgi:cobalamin biosynthesis protein CobT
MALLEQYEVENYLKSTAKRAELRVQWGDDNTVATDGKTVFLPRITNKTTREQAEDMIGFVAHEGSHILHSDFKLLEETGVSAETSFLGAISNLLEDDNVDAINASEFIGDRQIRNASVSRALKNIADNFGAAKDKGGGVLPKQLDDVATITAWSIDTRSDFYPSISQHADAIEGLLSDEAKARLEKLRKGDYYHKLKALREDHTKARTRGAYALAKRIYEEVFDQDAQKEEERCKKEMQESESGKGEGKSKGKGSAKAKDGDGDKGDELRGEWAELDYKPYLTDQHDPFKIGSPKEGMHLSYAKYKRSDYTTYTPTPLEQTIIVDYVKGTSNYGPIAVGERTDGYSRGVSTDTTGFANQVRMLLQIRSRSRTQYGVKRGTIHPGNTYRVVLKNAPGYNERVFKRTIQSDTLDTAVYWLVDISGSMSGGKYMNAMAASCKINAAVGNALRIPLAISGFTEHECRNAMFLWRKFETQILPNDKLLARMGHSGSYMNQNCDGDSILFAYQQLKQRKEKRKLLIVASDGSPASSKGGDVYGYTKDLVSKMEADKSVDIYAIGIMDDNVKRIYKHNEVINDASELEKALLNVIEKRIL